MKKSASVNKGDFQYMYSRKKRLLISSIILVMSVLIIYFTGIIIYDTNKSIYSVIAAVASLPAAKTITLLAVIIPYKSGTKQEYDNINEIISGKNGNLLCDLAISSVQKVTFVNYVSIIDCHVVMYSDYKKIDISYGEEFVKKILDENCNYSSIKIYTDMSQYMKRLQAIRGAEENKNMDERIAKKLLSYSM